MVMTAASSLISELRGSLVEESARIAQAFAATGEGRAAVAQRTRLIEDLLSRLWRDLVAGDDAGPRDFALVATGGFGRGWLFPYSDIDLLFLHADRRSEEAYKDVVRRFSQELWDLKLKLSPATRTLAECDRFDPNNVEFTISLLDSRYLAGDRKVFERLHNTIIPKLVSRESRVIVQRLSDLTRARYNKFGNTVFHLEPNVKDGRGGLRDYSLACWLALIAAIDEQGSWPDETSLLPVSLRVPFEAALDFLM